MDRRRFLLTSAAAHLAAPLTCLLITPSVVAAQQAGKLVRIGVLHGGSARTTGPLLDEFRAGLRDFGYKEGHSVTIDVRFAEGNPELLPHLAADLVRPRVDVIVASASPAALAARKTSDKIPIVMIGVGDPIALGLVASLSRPGGNVTGTASYLPELSGKSLELMRDLLPGMARLAVLWTAGSWRSCELWTGGRASVPTCGRVCR
jgi:putative ABC transport system substrate-binding protein